MTQFTKKLKIIAIDQATFEKVYNEDLVLQSLGSVIGDLKDAEKKAVVTANAKLFVAKKIPGWSAPINNLASFNSIMKNFCSKTSVERGEAQPYFELLLKWLEACNVDLVVEGSDDIARLATHGLKISNGKIVQAVDIDKFKVEVSSLMTKINKQDIAAKVSKQLAEADFWGLVMEMLAVEETYDLLGLMGARMLMNKADREWLDTQLGGVNVLLNRQGKLSTGIVSLMGMVALASVKGEPMLASAVKYIKNPILGEDVVDIPLRIKAGEELTKFDDRKKKHEEGFLTFKTSMTQMKAYKPLFEALDAATKAKINKSTMSFTI